MKGRHSCIDGHASGYTFLQGQAGKILKSTPHLPFDPATPLQGLYPTDILIYVHKDVLKDTPSSTVTTMAEDWK